MSCPICDDPSSPHHGRVETKHLTVQEVYVARTLGILLASYDGRGSVPVEWIENVRARKAGG